MDDGNDYKGDGNNVINCFGKNNSCGFFISKKQKKFATDELICPFMLELHCDLVLVNDIYFYKCDAIENLLQMVSHK